MKPLAWSIAVLLLLAVAGVAYWSYVPSSLPEAGLAPAVSAEPVAPALSVPSLRPAKPSPGAAKPSSVPAPIPVATGSAVPAPVVIGMANPASVHCTASGGTIAIKTNPAGGQYGVCYFEDNRQCEEWAFLRGTCPYGGRKITGYESDAQAFCAISGGTVHMENKPATCELPESAGSCAVDDFYANGAACKKI